MGNELWPIVHPQIGGRWMWLEQLLDRINDIHSLAAPVDTNGQTDAAEFIHNIQEFQPSAIHRLVELEVDRPNVVRVLGSE